MDCNFDSSDMLTLEGQSCQHLYPSDKDTPSCSCDSNDEVKEHRESGLFLCHHHRHEYKTMFWWGKNGH
jgi:hypothetical protein